MQARRIPARHGALWLVAGFRLFRTNPPLLTALTLGYLSAAVIINLVPYIGPLLLPILMPLLTVVVANGCRAAEQRRAVDGIVLGAGLRKQRDALIRLGGLHLLASLAVMVISEVVVGGDMFAELPAGRLSEEEMIGLFLRLLVIAAPFLMAFWFAPLLTGWDGVPALKAVFFSAVAAYRNWRAFLAYGTVLVAVGVVLPGLLLLLAAQADSPPLLAALSLTLRLALIFVVAPALTASLYISYRDVFAADEAGEAP